MRIFLDTEFIDGRHGPIFLSAAFLADGGHVLYSEMELNEARGLLQRHPNRFVQEHVISQFGVKPSERWAELPTRLAMWLDALGVAEAEVIYDYNLDFLLVEQLLERMPVQPAIRLLATHVGYLADDPDGNAAAAEVWAALKSSEGIGRHHALADVYALRLKFETVHGFQVDYPDELSFPQGEPFELVAVVTVVMHMFEIAHADTSDGRTLSIGAETQGVDWRELREGQTIICECTANPWVRVERVKLVEPL